MTSSSSCHLLDILAMLEARGTKCPKGYLRFLETPLPLDALMEAWCLFCLSLSGIYPRWWCFKLSKHSVGVAIDGSDVALRGIPVYFPHMRGPRTTASVGKPTRFRSQHNCVKYVAEVDEARGTFCKEVLEHQANACLSKRGRLFENDGG